jgi:hypothetical protein
VYATAFTMIGAGQDTRTVLMGFAMVFMSLLALPVLMRFFTWTTGHVADSVAGGGFLQSALGGAVAIGAVRGWAGGSGGAVGQARLMSARLGPSDQGPSGAAAPVAGVRHGAAPAGAAPGAAATSTGTAAAGGAAAGPAGAVAAGLAAGAASARRTAADAIQPPDTR